MSETHGRVDYRSLFRGTPTPLLVLDDKLVIVEVNDAYLAATVRTREETVGRPVFEAFPDNPADPQASGVAMLGTSLRRVLRTGATDVMAVQRYDIPQPGGGFETRWWSPVNAPVFGPGGEVVHIVHRVEDVTAYVLAQQDGTDLHRLTDELRVRTQQMAAEVFAHRRLQEEHRTLRALADRLDQAGRIKECELAVAALVAAAEPAGDVLAEVVQVVGARLGWTVVEFWTVDQVAGVLRRTACWTAAPQDSPGSAADVLPPGRDVPGRAWQAGEPIWEQGPAGDAGLRAALGVPLPGGAEVLGVLVCYSDTGSVDEDVREAVLTAISAQLAGFVGRRRAAHLAAELNRTREEYIALAGHELRTPLTSIQAYTDLLLEDPDLNADQRDLVQVVRRNAGSLYAMVVKLLDVAGLRSGHLDVHRRPTDLAAIVRDAAGDARERAGARVAVAVDAPASVPAEGDPQRLRQVVDELVANALAWAADGTEIGLRLRADPHAAVLSVSNVGPPIPDDERASLFDLFFRGGTARHGGVPGTGLGLTLARAIVEQHGGTIRVSDPGERPTVFTVRLPTRTRSP